MLITSYDCQQEIRLQVMCANTNSKIKALINLQDPNVFFYIGPDRNFDLQNLEFEVKQVSELFCEDGLCCEQIEQSEFDNLDEQSQESCPQFH